MASSPALSEYQAFAKLQDALDQAASAARELAFFRSDQSREWERIAVLLGQETKHMVMQLAGDGRVGGARN